MNRPGHVPSLKSANVSALDSPEDNLLDLYLSLTCKERDARFVCTMRAAEISGLSVRTIQFWIECGYVQALFIGRKYRVDLDSLRQYLRAQMQKHSSA
jgi:excisionase family DNA binding protein